MTTSTREDRGTTAADRAPWLHLGIGLVISAAGTALIGGILLFLLDNMWWVALGSVISVFGGGVYLGRSTAQLEPLYGTLLAAAFFALAFLAIFVGSFLEQLPDPLPGLVIGDSTFFFVSPLLVLGSGVIGSIIGGQMVYWTKSRTD